jgi:hypothetical protein
VPKRDREDASGPTGDALSVASLSSTMASFWIIFVVLAMLCPFLDSILYRYHVKNVTNLFETLI